MKIITRYILQSFLTAFFLAWLVLTFVLSIGLLYRVIQLLADGLQFSTVAQFIFAGLPEMLGFTIPLALLVSAMLVFGRMSGDSEIAAMKACGISFLAIMRGPIVVAVLCSILAFFLQNEVMPKAHHLRRTILSQAKLEVGLEVLEPGRFVDEIKGFTFFCARRDNNWLYDLYVIDRRDPDFVREISAERALVVQAGDSVRLDMSNVRIDPIDDHLPGVGYASDFSYTIPNAFRNRPYTKRLKDYSLNELSNEITRLKENPEGIPEKPRAAALSKTRFILNSRIVWALASLCFVLVGVPIGTRGQRKESNIGMAMCLGIGLSFFIFLILSETLSDKPMAFPYVLVWTPVLICAGAATWLIPRNQ